jgi:hypothetical protein
MTAIMAQVNALAKHGKMDGAASITPKRSRLGKRRAKKDMNRHGSGQHLIS